MSHYLIKIVARAPAVAITRQNGFNLSKGSPDLCDLTRRGLTIRNTHLFWSSGTVYTRFWQYWTSSEKSKANELKLTSPFPLLRGLSNRLVLGLVTDIVIALFILKIRENYYRVKLIAFSRPSLHSVFTA